MARAGICPRCNSIDTSIEVELNGKVEAKGVCLDCGYETMPVRTENREDLDLLVESVQRSFSRSVVASSDGMSGIIAELSNEIAILRKSLCSSNMSCETCPLHKIDDDIEIDESNPKCEGWVARKSSLGLCCSSQSQEAVFGEIAKIYSDVFSFDL